MHSLECLSHNFSVLATCGKTSWLVVSFYVHVNTLYVSYLGLYRLRWLHQEGDEAASESTLHTDSSN